MWIHMCNQLRESSSMNAITTITLPFIEQPLLLEEPSPWPPKKVDDHDL